jgi:hypothetical protein
MLKRPSGSRGTSTEPSRDHDPAPADEPHLLTLDDMLGFAEQSKLDQAALAQSTPEEADARREVYRLQDENYLRLTVAKRAQGYGDCGHEADIASQQAVTTARQHVAWRAAVSTSRLAPVAPAPTASTAVRPRERRDRSGRSSARSGDSGDDGGSEPPPAGWHWAQPRAWQPPPAVWPWSIGRDTRAAQAVSA